MPAAGDESWHSLETLAGDALAAESVNVSDEFAKIQSIIAKSGEDRVRGLSERSLTMFSEGMHQTAVETITKAISVHPNNATLRANRSSMYLRMGRLEDALHDAKLCCMMQPNWSQSHLVCGKVLLRMGRQSKAISSLHNAISCSKEPLPEAEELLRSIRRSTTASPPPYSHSPPLPSPRGYGVDYSLSAGHSNYSPHGRRPSDGWRRRASEYEQQPTYPPFSSPQQLPQPESAVTRSPPQLQQLPPVPKKSLGALGVIANIFLCFITTAAVCVVGKLSGEPRGVIIQLGITATWSSVMSAYLEKRVPWKRCVASLTLLAITFLIAGTVPLYYVAICCVVAMHGLSVASSSKAAVAKTDCGLFSRFLMFVGVSHQVFGAVSGVWYRNPVFAMLSLVGLTTFAAPLQSDISLLQPLGITSREWLWVLVNAVLGSALLAALSTADVPCQCYHNAYGDSTIWWL